MHNTIISHREMEYKENKGLQRGMNFDEDRPHSIVLMSTLPNAPYTDEIDDQGMVIYEGHDIKSSDIDEKKSTDQQMRNDSGSLTENGKFYKAAKDYEANKKDARKVQVYRKIRSGVWVDQGFYNLIGANYINDGKRKVFKFKLTPSSDNVAKDYHPDIKHDRRIPGNVMQEVYKRDNGKCVECGSEDNLHFDHIVPFSKGGSSKDSKNIQLLCMRHNLEKGNSFKY
tara:strand:- start:88 stop:768 length:681 start_codon:yes stop_codon:yes gene_type:complete